MKTIPLMFAIASVALLSACNGDSEPNVAPEFGANSFVTETDVSITDQLIATDKNGDSVTFSVTVPAQNGSVTLAPNGSFTYTPAAEFTGTDSFMVDVSDGELSVTGAVTVDVTVAIVSFLHYSRSAFNQTEEAAALPLNGRSFTQDAQTEADYADVLNGQ